MSWLKFRRRKADEPAQAREEPPAVCEEALAPGETDDSGTRHASSQDLHPTEPFVAPAGEEAPTSLGGNVPPPQNPPEREPSCAPEQDEPPQTEPQKPLGRLWLKASRPLLSDIHRLRLRLGRASLSGAPVEGEQTPTSADNPAQRAPDPAKEAASVDVPKETCEAPLDATPTAQGSPSEARGPEAAKAQDVGKPETNALRKSLKQRLKVNLLEGTKARRPTAPIRIVVGYLPEVTERDAIEYATGIAEKHFDQLGLASYDAFEYAKGYAYEVHEGGPGRAYLPQIIEYFNSQGPFKTGEDVKVVLRTATRKVEVQRTREGLAAIMLPEASEAQPTDWLEPGELLIPALNKRTGLLVVGAAMFASGFLAMVVSALLARHQPYVDPPPAAVVELRFQDLPSAQWPALTAIAEGTYVRALRYRNGRWEAPEVSRWAADPPPAGPVSADTLINEGNAIANAFTSAGGAASGLASVQALVSRGLLPTLPAWVDPAAPLAQGHVVSNVPVDPVVCGEIETRAGRSAQVPSFGSASLAPGPFGCANLSALGPPDLRFYRKF